MSFHVYFVLVLVILFFANKPMDATILAKSSIEKCLVRESASQPSLNGTVCKEKLSITLSVLPRQQAGAESLRLLTIDAATAADGGSIEFQHPMQVLLSVSEVLLFHPMKYKAMVWGDLYENIIHKSSTLGLYDRCDSNWDSESPTCGFAKDRQGNKVWGSQGFCCSCSISDFFGDGRSHIRGGEVCGGLGGANAHCFRWVEGESFNAFSLNSGRTTYFEILVFLKTYNSETGEYDVETIKIGPRNPTQASKDGTSIARLIGQFSHFEEVVDISDKIMLLPRVTDSSKEFVDFCLAASEMGVNPILLLDPSLYTEDGSECDKVGVNPNTFRGQANRCSQRKEDCLKKQPMDLLREDIESKKNGKPLKYSLSRYPNLFLGREINSTTSLTLWLQHPSTTPIVVHLEVDAAVLQYHQNVAEGKILASSVPIFEGHSGEGQLSISVINLSGLVAEFSFRLEPCSIGVNTSPAQSFTMGANAKKDLIFQLFVGDLAGAERWCEAELVDSQGVVVDERIINFNTSDTTQIVAGGGGVSRTPESDESGKATGPIGWIKNAFEFLKNLIPGGIFSLIFTVIGILILLKIIHMFCCKSNNSSGKDNSKPMSRLCKLPIVLLLSLLAPIILIGKRIFKKKEVEGPPKNKEKEYELEDVEKHTGTSQSLGISAAEEYQVKDESNIHVALLWTELPSDKNKQFTIANEATEHALNIQKLSLGGSMEVHIRVFLPLDLKNRDSNYSCMINAIGEDPGPRFCMRGLLTCTLISPRSYSFCIPNSDGYQLQKVRYNSHKGMYENVSPSCFNDMTFFSTPISIIQPEIRSFSHCMKEYNLWTLNDNLL